MRPSAFCEALLAVLVLLPFAAGILTSSFDLPVTRSELKPPVAVELYKYVPDREPLTNIPPELGG